MKVSTFALVGFVYFFVNGAGLPLGLLYTGLLTPMFYGWLATRGYQWVLLPLLLVLVPFAAVHLANGADGLLYLKSSLLVASAYIYGYALYAWLNRRPERVERLFHQLLVANFCLTLVAVLALFTPLKKVFWNFSSISPGIQGLPRLTLFTYEPSYYSTLLVPLFVYFLLKFLQRLTPNRLLLWLMVAIPLGLSFSLGVLAALVLALGGYATLRLWQRRHKKKLITLATFLLVSGSTVLLGVGIFYPENPLFRRIGNVYLGKDTSGKGRTSDAFSLAYQIAAQKSVWFGVGLGQLKVVGDPIIRQFYQIPPTVTASVAIPCAFAETLAVFGIAGAVVRLLLQLMLFYYNKVFSNRYTTILFFFVFIYQFSGSYFTNVAEITLWVLCFNPVFKSFNTG